MKSARKAIVTQIQTQTGNTFGEVAGATSLRRVLRSLTRIRGCYVFMIRETASPESWAQLVKEHYAVVYLINDLTVDKGADVMDDIDEMRDQVELALSKFIPDDQREAMIKASGELIPSENEIVMWQDIWTTQFTRTTSP